MQKSMIINGFVDFDTFFNEFVAFSHKTHFQRPEKRYNRDFFFEILNRPIGFHVKFFRGKNR